jgi:predicted small integral membrane protein
MAGWFQDNLGWMYWTAPSAVMFAGLFLTIAGLGIRDHFVPSYARKGFLPLATTRGDRLFIGILIIIAIHIGWILVFESTALYGATAVAGIVFGCVARWG